MMTATSPSNFPTPCHEDMMNKILGSGSDNVGDLFGMVDSVISMGDPQTEQPSLEPTPLGPNVVSVEAVALSSAPWHNDTSFFESLRLLLKEPPADATDLTVNEQTLHKNGVNKRRISNCSTTSCDTETSDDSAVSSFRSSHLEQWNQRYHELVEFQSEFKHCLVPLNWPKNPSLAHWVKRQRYQYRIKMEGKHSTMTEERQSALQRLGFVWDSHAAGWEERWDELREFRERHGHCNVPKKYPENPQLAVWVKCQRRQFKLFSEGKSSNMTRQRIERLQVLGFVFNPRLKKKLAYYR